MSNNELKLAAMICVGGVIAVYLMAQCAVNVAQG